MSMFNVIFPLAFRTTLIVVFTLCVLSLVSCCSFVLLLFIFVYVSWFFLKKVLNFT